MNHHGTHRTHQHLRSRHRDHTGRGSRNAIDFHCNIALILHQHVVDLRCRHTITARTVDPDRNVTAATKQLLLKKSRCDIIVKPALLRNRSIQKQHPLRDLLACGLVSDLSALPVPKLFHRMLSSLSPVLPSRRLLRYPFLRIFT